MKRRMNYTTNLYKYKLTEYISLYLECLKGNWVETYACCVCTSIQLQCSLHFTTNIYRSIFVNFQNPINNFPRYFWCVCMCYVWLHILFFFCFVSCFHCSFTSYVIIILFQHNFILCILWLSSIVNHSFE